METYLTEGLYAGDLKDLVLRTISIDEYESKVDKDAIVVGFFVKSESPAKDLSMFIENGNYDILDTEVSPSTDENGNYVVFVEMLRNNKFFKGLKEILDDVDNLTSINHWYFSHDDDEEPAIFNKENVSIFIRTEKQKASEFNETEVSTLTFLKDSLLSDVNLSGKKLKLSKGHLSETYEYVALSDPTLINFLLGLNQEPISLLETDLRVCRRLQNMLGGNWDINKIKHYLVIQNNNNPNKVLVLK